MTYPFPIKYPVTSSFKDHVNAGGVEASFPGVDYATPFRTPIFAIFDCFIQYETDNFGNTYLVMASDVSNERFDILHVDEVIHDHEHVKEGTLVGYTGNKGISTGPHAHITYRPNWNADHSDAPVDCEEKLNRLIDKPVVIPQLSVRESTGIPVIDHGTVNTTDFQRAGVDMANAYGYSQMTGIVTGALIGIAVQKDPTLLPYISYYITLATPVVNVSLLVGKKLYQHLMTKLSNLA